MVVQRDVMEIRSVRQREVLLRLLASQTAKVLNMSRIAAELGLRKERVHDYVHLLESVFLVHRLEAFGRTLVETDDGRVAGVEIKAATSAGPADFRGLQQLRSKLGNRFVAGVVLHLGQRSFHQAGNLFAVPMDRLWE